MSAKLRLMCVLAHPDDESLGMGGTLAKYSGEGIDTYLVTATRGERGRFGEGGTRPDDYMVGKAREDELKAAAAELGIREVHFLDYLDGDLDQADPVQATGRIVRHLRRIRPQVVITFGPEGAYGHPDHIAISQFTTAAVVCAADPDHQVHSAGQEAFDAHRVSKLYYMAWPEDKWAAYQTAFKNLQIKVDGLERRATPWPQWAITTTIDTRTYWPQVWRAVCCHESQMSIYRQLENLSEQHHWALWGTQQYYRAFSLVNGGRSHETDLFEGIPRSEDGE
ncbi:MAG: PIG-L family deacetylase [Acidobacteriota bacterium]